MMNQLKCWKRLQTCVPRLLAVFFFMALAGCVQKYPVSHYAHPGDTIVLGLGGVQRNTNGTQNLQPSDLTITLTKDSDNTVSTVPAGAIYKVFPDYNSGLSASALNKQSDPNAAPFNFVPFDGGWFVNVTVPEELTPGTYTISITSPTNKLVNTAYQPNAWVSEGDLTNIPLRIEATPAGLAETYASINQDYNAQFQYYPTKINRLDVSPPPAALANLTAVGGMQLVINFPSANYDSTLPLIALPYNHNPNISLLQNTIVNGNGTKSLVVLLSAPQGFVKAANQTALTPLLSDLSLSFFFYRASGSSIPANATQQLADFQIDQTRSHYYDLAGNVISGMQPAMTYK